MEAMTGLSTSCGRPVGCVRLSAPALVRALTGVALLSICVLAVHSAWGSGVEGWVLARRLGDPMMGAVAAAAGAGSLLAIGCVRSTRARVVALCVCGLLVLGIVCHAVYPWPTGELVVRNSSGTSTVVVKDLEVQVRTGRGLSARYRIAACTDGDSGFYASACWRTDTDVVVTRDEGATQRFQVSPTGIPSGDDVPHSPCNE